MLGRRRCYHHGGPNTRGAGAALVWQPGLAEARKRKVAWLAILHAAGLKHPGGRPAGSTLRLARSKEHRAVMAEAVKIIAERLPVLSDGSGVADRMLKLYGMSLDRIEQLLDDPYYVTGMDPKRDSQYIEIARMFQSGLLRIGEGLIQREKTDRLASLLENLKKSGEGEKKG
jgi:hypothetical protein